MAVKLMCSRVVTKPSYKEDMITEIPERRFEIDGYHIGDRLLEGVKFDVEFDASGEVLDVMVIDDTQRNYLEEKLNSKKWYHEAKLYAEGILSTGDEVNIPQSLKRKYFVNGINVAFIVVE
jgi:hypothetical protein